MLVGHPDFSVQPLNQPIFDDCLFYYTEGTRILLTHDENGLTLPRWSQVKKLFPAERTPFELAQASGLGIFTFAEAQPVSLPDDSVLSFEDFNVFRTMEPQTASLLCACKHLSMWYQSHKFCGKCAATLMPDQNERALRCPKCGHLIFPTIAPAVITAITCKDRILLARNVRYQHYALIAGYVEVGETLEHALRREVKEEVGLDIHSVCYLGDQPWGVSGSHMFAFHVQADDQQPITIQHSELADARWFTREEIEPIPHKVSIAYDLIERFRRGEL